MSLPDFDESKNPDEVIKSHLAALNLRFEEFTHPPLFSCDDASKLGLPPMLGTDTKNLFLQDENKHLLLLCTTCRKQVALNQLKKELGKKKVSFGDAESLFRTLRVSPGAVTVLGLLFDSQREVTLFLDREVAESSHVQMHPGRNDRTILLSQEGFRKFLTSIQVEPQVINVPTRVTEHV